MHQAAALICKPSRTAVAVFGMYENLDESTWMFSTASLELEQNHPPTEGFGSRTQLTKNFTHPISQ